MRSAILLTLLSACFASAMGTPAWTNPDAIPSCPTALDANASAELCAAIDLGRFGTPGELLRSSIFDAEAMPAPDPAPTMDDLDHSPLFTDISTEKPFIRGPEPPAALLAISGFACIGLLNWRRRISRTIQKSRRHVYTARGMA